MLHRVGQLVEDSTTLLEARGRVLIHHARRAGVTTAMMIGAALAAVAGFLTLVAALVVALAGPLGAPGALAVGGGVLLVIAIGAAAYAAKRGPDEEEEKLQLQAALARDHLRQSFAPPEPTDTRARAVAALQSAAKNPAAIALAVGALLAALVNAKRVTKFGRIVALTGVASTLAGAVREVVQLVERVRESHARTNGATRNERRAPRTPVARK